MSVRGRGLRVQSPSLTLNGSKAGASRDALVGTLRRGGLTRNRALAVVADIDVLADALKEVERAAVLEMVRGW